MVSQTLRGDPYGQAIRPMEDGGLTVQHLPHGLQKALPRCRLFSYLSPGSIRRDGLRPAVGGVVTRRG